MFKVNYSVLSYYPDIYLRSNLAIGVAFGSRRKLS